MNTEQNMHDAACSELARWTEDNSRYLAASLHWLRLRLRQMAPTAPGDPPAEAVMSEAPRASSVQGRSWFARKTGIATTSTASVPLLSHLPSPI